MPTTSGSLSSSMRMLALAGAVLALVAVIWLAFGSKKSDSSDAGTDDGKPVATEKDRPRNPGATAIEVIPTRASGQVRATTGEPLAGAVVTLAPFDRDAGEPHTVETNGEGTWSMTGLDPGRYALSASATGYLASVRSEVALRAGNDNAGLDLSLEPGGNTLSGVVSDKIGGVIEGALVQVTPQSGVLRLRERDSYFTLTDEQGRYAVQVPDGRHRVRASHVDYTAESLVLEFAKQPRTQSFTLVPTAVIEGIAVREQDGAPVAGAEVSWSRERTIVTPDGGRISTIDRGGRVVADEAGRFRISGLSPGLVLLAGRASRLASADPMQVPVGIAERVTGVELRLADAGDLEGRVVSASDGAGIEGAQIELMSPMNGGGGGGAGARTDANGQFVVRGVLPGEYRVLASAEGWTSGADAMPRVEIGGQPSSVLIELERGLAIRGHVEPAGQAEVAIELRPESMGMGMGGGGMRMLSGAGPTQAAADTGAFEIGPVQPGRYTLEARTADGRGGTVDVEVGADGPQDIVIALEQRAILSGRVQDFNGKLLDDVSVRARKRRTDGGSVSVVVNGQELTALSSPTSTDGRFEIAGLAAGTWTIEVVDAQGDLLPMDSGQQLELALAEGQNQDIVLRVEPRDGTISGVVRDADGVPVADAWVSATFVPELAKPEKGPEGRAEMRMMMITDDGGGAGSTLPPVLTDDTGKFEFTHLRTGSYTLTAELGGGVSKATLEDVRPNADVTLELAPLGTIEGNVISNGGPANNCMAKIMGPSPRNVRVRDGKFEVTRLEPGRYTVEVSAGDGSKSASVVVEPGATATVELALERLAKITGKIVDEAGAPIAKAEVMIGAGEGGRIEVSREHGDPQIFTDDDGTFETHAAAGGRVLLVHVEGVPMPIVIKPFVVESGEDLDLGELRKQELEGMMRMGGPDGEAGPAGEGGP
jgi:hypothetical protein